MIANGLISTSSASFSIVSFDNFFKVSANCSAVFPSSPTSFATCVASSADTSPNPLL